MALFPGPPNWASSTSYTANQSMVAASIPAGQFYYLTTATGTSASAAPAWPSTFGATVNDGTCTWICAMHARLPWTASHAYVTNSSQTAQYPWADQVITNPGASGSVVAQCVVSGTSANAQPNWPTAAQLTNSGPAGYLFNTVTDGTVVWSDTGFIPGAASVWTASHAYATGASVIVGQHYWNATTGGTSGTTPQPFTYVVDNTVVWAIVGVN